jgi:hypothetical protein
MKQELYPSVYIWRAGSPGRKKLMDALVAFPLLLWWMLKGYSIMVWNGSIPGQSECSNCGGIAVVNGKCEMCGHSA